MPAPAAVRRPLLAAVALAALSLAACGTADDAQEVDAAPDSTTTDLPAAAAPSTDAPADPPDSAADEGAADEGAVGTDDTTTTTVAPPAGIYDAAGAGMLSPTVSGHLPRVYVPNEVSGTVTVIDPATYQVIDTFPSGFIPQHVVPSYDLSTLYVLNNSGNTIVPIDPATGAPGAAIPVDDPYNLYFLPDGSEAIVVAEADRRLDFVDPRTFEVHSSLPVACAGVNHIDYSADGSYAIATCEFDGQLLKIDLASRQVVASMQLDITQSGKVDPVKPVAQPQDVRLSADGSVFFVADLITDGVYLIDGDSFTQVGFVRTGVAAHGLYPSRDGTQLYVINRGTNTIPAPGSFVGQAQGSVAVLDMATREVVAEWPIPGGGSPDMGNVTADGSQLWVAGRYDAEVYVFDTATGELVARIPVGQNPHGLTVWPQPGRFSLGHTGNMR